MARIIIPTPLRRFAGDVAHIEVPGKTVGESINKLAGMFPELQHHLIDTEGKIRKFVKIFVGEDDILSLQKNDTPVNKESVISIIPAIPGG